MKIKYVNGADIRNTTDTDFAGFSTSNYSPLVPKGAVWMEQYLKPEKDLMLHIIETEKKFRQFKDARTFLEKEARKRGPCPPFAKKRERRSGRTLVWVDGATVRKFLDPYFFLGGHDLVYSYIPKNEIWIDALNYSNDQQFTIIHELKERVLMARGMEYHSAHDYALAEERHYRRKAGVARFENG